MARIIGTSGAWSDITDDVRGWGFRVRDPADVEPLLAKLRQDYRSLAATKAGEAARRVAAARRRIEHLRSETGLFRRILNRFEIQGWEQKIGQLRSDETRHINRLRISIQRLERLTKSPELAGAQAELDVIAQLRRLPDQYTVMNGLHLESERYIHFGGRPLQSAQIDHLVLGFSGIFVIETKLWSKAFVESGVFHDPFDQVRRSAYLCYDLVRRRFGKVIVRSIIACAGTLPEAPPDTYAKVVHPTEINGYISWFKDRELTPRKIVSLRRFLERRGR